MTEIAERFIEKAVARFDQLCQCEDDPASMDYPGGFGLEDFLLDVDEYWDDLDKYVEHAIKYANDLAEQETLSFYYPQDPMGGLPAFLNDVYSSLF